jgi:hypothetical protein
MFWYFAGVSMEESSDDALDMSKGASCKFPDNLAILPEDNELTTKVLSPLEDIITVQDLIIRKEKEMS